MQELDASMSQEEVIGIATGSVLGFVVIFTILVTIFVKRSKDKRKRKFMEDNGDDYYYNPISGNSWKTTQSTEMIIITIPSKETKRRWSIMT